MLWVFPRPVKSDYLNLQEKKKKADIENEIQKKKKKRLKNASVEWSVVNSSGKINQKVLAC